MIVVWSVLSADGVQPPDPPSTMPDPEAMSPARRSPAVRKAQATGSRRPDLLERQPADTP